MKVAWKNISNVKTGEICGEDVFDPSSFVLLIHKGAVLDSKLIEFLLKHQASWIPVLEEEAEKKEENLALNVEVETVVSNEEILVSELPLVVSEEKYHQNISRFSEVASGIINKGTFKSSEITNLCNDVVNEVIKSQSCILNFLTEFSPGFIIKHGINTGILSAIIAHQLGQPWHYLVQLVKAALLHDIGLIYALKEKSLDFIEDIKNQYGMSLIDRVKLHPLLSVRIIKKIDSDFFEREVEEAIIEHHEKYNGTGFPFRKKGKQINLYSRILAVADSYDTLITSKDRKTMMEPYDALKWIISNINTIFDPDAVRAFVTVAGIYPTGTIVKLNNGKIGRVISRGEKSIGRPIILVEGEEIELEKNKGLFISEVKGIDKMEAFGST